MKKHNVSEKKQKQIDKYIKTPLKIGDRIYVKKSSIGYSRNPDGETLCKVISIGKKITIQNESFKYTIDKSEITSKFTMYIGENPFSEYVDQTRSVLFSLESIIFGLDILDDREKYEINGVKVKCLNWNPFIFKEGKKYFYQRDFVWSIRDNQLLIESIYQGIDCGKIIVRKRGWKELEELKGESELAFHDIVDGKQRLHAIKSFINNEYTDLNGNFYSDLSDYSQSKLTDHHLFSYGEMPENSKDSDVIKQFLRLNFTGVPQSQSHIDYVKSLDV